MGLRTASVRHPHAEVMAPALTETNQTQTFKLPPDEQSASPINSSAKQQHGEAVYIAREAATCKSLPLPLSNGKASSPPSDAFGSPLAAAANREPLANERCPPPPPSMADRDTMGLRKMNLDDVTDLLKVEDEHIFDNLAAGETEELLQVFKGLDGETDNLADELFSVDELNSISIEEERECANEQRIDGMLDVVNEHHSKLERQLDFLLRRIRKYQMRTMGHHVSGEVAGVFENVCRAVKRDTTEALGESSTSSLLDVTNDLPHKPLTPVMTKNLMKRLELTNAMCANAAFRARMKKNALGSVTEPFRQPQAPIIELPKWPSRERKELQNVAGFLESEMRLVQEEVDSEATVSSSGAESGDDAETYNNPHQQHLAIHKRAAWKYATDRAAIGAKWTWLQCQIADLEYKIRQYTELYRKMRANKDPVILGDASPPHVMSTPSPPNCLNGYRGQLPGATATGRNGESASASTKSPISTTEYQCARTRPLVNFRKRKLTQVSGLHRVSRKADRPATMRCNCTPPLHSCALCTGRIDPTRPRDQPEYLSRNERLALLDSSYHPVFSMNDAVSASLHMEGIMKTHDWKQWSVRSSAKVLAKNERPETSTNSKESGSSSGRSKKSIDHRKKNNNRLIKPSTANALTAKIKNRSRSGKKKTRTSSSSSRSRKRPRKSSAQSLGSDGNDDDVDVASGSKFDSRSGSPLLPHAISNLKHRSRADSYDIDNIIIPSSVAASVRVEKLQYKEILTPKWRHVPEDDSASTNKHDVKNNGVVKTSQDTDKELFEDLSDAAVLIRHEKSEQEERKKFLSYLKPIGYRGSRANRRTDSRAESSGANTPDPMSPAPNATFDGAAAALTENASRPATPKIDDHHLPSSSRRRTISNNRGVESQPQTPDALSVPPYEKRVFPLSEETYQRMLRRMQLQQIKQDQSEETSESRPATPSVTSTPLSSALRESEPDPGAISSEWKNRRQGGNSAVQEHDSESTESAFGDEDLDPTDPEWESQQADKSR